MGSKNDNTNPWCTSDTTPLETISFAEIMAEEYAHQVQDREQKRYSSSNELGKLLPSNRLYSTEVDADRKKKEENPSCSNRTTEEVDGLFGKNLDANIAGEETIFDCDSDAVIAQMLQSQFDHEYNEELRRIEQHKNKDSKVTVTLDKYRRHGDLEFLHDSDDFIEDDGEHRQGDWDRFEANEKILDAIPKCGFKIDKEGEMITKHDPQLCGVRNACRVMSFPPEFPTGDGAGFDMKLSNKAFNQLKTYSRKGSKKNKMDDRKVNMATVEMGIDAPTRMLLFKLISNQILEQINGIISTGKEALILHANSDPAYVGNANGYNGTLCSPQLLPKECAIKIFKTTLNEFKQRDRYIKDDYRFKDRFSKQNSRVVIHMWAEKEMHNIMRMQSVGINCPDVVILKKHILVMSFIGDNHNAAPKLKDARLSLSELSIAYEEIVAAVHKLYNDAKLVHADLSEYNILWHNEKCWFIDVAQSVDREHPSALEFLMRDCGNIITFFKKRGLPKIFTKEELFEFVTSLNAKTYNAAMLERIHAHGSSIAEATAPNQDQCPDELKPFEYPFDLAWEKSQCERLKQNPTQSDNASEIPIIDEAACALKVLKIKSFNDTPT
ncbi:serine/threonine-protein kinase RIO3 [Eurosta solidaginis]|uniref:serine/threonine-protein kinase RIO3 n=1 Tax=Eurosta solidaginis TaxID=178769 RepID=UPI003530ABF7